MAVDVVVVGQIARDLVLGVAEAPNTGHSATVRYRSEILGGKGANQAVGLAQLGMAVTLVGVVGDDAVGTDLIEQAGLDGIDTASIVRRGDTETALVVDVVDKGGHWRYLEHIPRGTLVTAADVAAAGAAIAAAESVVVQLQQPAGTAREAVGLARSSGARVVLDGAPSGDTHTRDELLSSADVVRADAVETRLLTGIDVATVEDAVRAAGSLLGHGPSLVVLEVPGTGHVFVDTHGHLFMPNTRATVRDTTGGGDALVAGLTATLTHGGSVPEAARLAVAAAGATVEHPGGRPDLTPAALRRHLDQLPGRPGTAGPAR